MKHVTRDQLKSKEKMYTDILEKIKTVPVTVREDTCSVRPIIIDPTKCIGCGSCARVCQCDVLLPSLQKGEPPRVCYPGECYYCGACVMACPRPGAIRLSHPLMNQAKFVETRKPSEP